MWGLHSSFYELDSCDKDIFSSKGTHIAGIHLNSARWPADTRDCGASGTVDVSKMEACDPVRVRLLMFAEAREVTGAGESAIRVLPASSPTELMHAVVAAHPECVLIHLADY